jgi:hypothetical protein
MCVIISLFLTLVSGDFSYGYKKKKKRGDVTKRERSLAHK